MFIMRGKTNTRFIGWVVEGGGGFSLFSLSAWRDCGDDLCEAKWRVAVVGEGGTGEIDRVTTQREAKQAAAAQTSTRRGAIGYPLLVLRAAFRVGALGRRKKGPRELRKHVCACARMDVRRDPRAWRNVRGFQKATEWVRLSWTLNWTQT